MKNGDLWFGFFYLKYNDFKNKFKVFSDIIDIKRRYIDY